VKVMLRIAMILISVLVGFTANKVIHLAYMKTVKVKYDYLMSIGFIKNTNNGNLQFVKGNIVLTDNQIDAISLFELKEKYH